MTEPETRQRLPWGSVLTSAALAGIVVAVYRGASTGVSSLPWASTWAAALAGVAVFLAMRWWQNYAWGIIAGLFVVLHPLYLEKARTLPGAVVAEALHLGVLAGVVAAWQAVFWPRFAWRSWLAGAVMLCAALALAWPLQPRMGFLATCLVCFGLLGSAILATRWNQRRANPAPSWLNIGAAALLGLVVPAGGVLLAPLAVRHFRWQQIPVQPAIGDPLDYWEEVVSTPVEDFQVDAFRPAQLNQWAWPRGWVVLPLMAWGLWCSFRRGWKQSARRKPPVAWVLTLFALIELAGACLRPGSEAEVPLLSLAALAALLSVFGIADVLRGFMEKLVLAPPQERDQ
jgi:hypothetical protein